LKDDKEVKEKLRRYVENEEYISFVVNKLSVGIGIGLVRCRIVSSVQFAVSH